MQPEIEKDEVRAEGGGHAKPLYACLGAIDTVPLRFHECAGFFEALRVGIDGEDFGFHGGEGGCVL